MKETGIISREDVDAFFENLRVVESRPGDNTRDRTEFEKVIKTDPRIVFDMIDFYTGTLKRLADQNGNTINEGPRTTSETKATKAYIQLRNSVENGSFGDLQRELPRALTFQTSHDNEATIRLPPDCFLYKVVMIKKHWDKLQ